MSELEPALNTITMILGKRGSGKSDFVIGNPEHDIPGFFDLYLEKGMKILIVLTMDHPSYRHIPFIFQDQLPRWKQGIYKIIVNRRFIHEFCMFINSLDSMYNTFILMEDMAKHTRLRVSAGMNDLIIDSKQKNIDMVGMYHTWMQMPDELYGLVDILEIFKVKGSPKKREDSMPNYYEEAYATWQRVMNHPSRFYHETVFCDNE